ncbi:hypothetical protein SEA_NEOS5_86 [Mycobacterium phage Neos5]|nr:hypothetical protein SEA_MORTY007_85 [Mycobacterium phage Morty007]AZF93887.1 hypothetical protein SEA_MARLEY1013_87 [Mycobacterium phage Marley1013]QYW01194.1 hypothetical protein SEA_YINZ_86 [Mycobacterium phage Yinz]QYW01699.1 hypothetical protein SEA_NEOS5_86 [Mycobacterium phage Neos5]
MTFREALAAHLSGKADRVYLFNPRTNERRSSTVTADEIAGIDVQYDEGEQGTSDYGDEFTRLPYITVTATLTDGSRIQADPGWCVESLLRQACGLEVNP